MMSELEPRYLLDACIPLGQMELWSGKYVEANRVLPQGAPDDLVLFYAQRHDLTVITRDTGFIVHALNKNTPIVWQNQQGERFLIRGDISFMEKANPPVRGKRTRALLRSDRIILP